MKVNRQTLLHQLETVSPGLAKRESIEQSTCFVFKDGRVMTFNDELFCYRDSEARITGAVTADKLLQMLSKMTEEDLDIETGEADQRHQLVVKGKRRRAGIAMEAVVTLPVDGIEQPEKWVQLDDEFCDAMKIVLQCASTDPSSSFYLTCVHIHPEYLEAVDNFQMTRFPINTKVKKSTLVTRSAIQHIASMGMTEMAVTKTWLHFRNPDGLVIACRRAIEEYPDLGSVMALEDGEDVTLPGGLAEAVAKAEVFSGDNADDNVVTISLKPDKLKIRSDGATGWYEELKGIKYSGRPLTFRIAPKLLTEISKRHNECQVGNNPSAKLRVDTGRFIYIACLMPPEDE